MAASLIQMHRNGLDTSAPKTNQQRPSGVEWAMEVPRVILIAHRMAAMAVGLALWCVLPATVATQAANDTADASMQLREIFYRTNF
jgi:hypothetical protein